MYHRIPTSTLQQLLTESMVRYEHSGEPRTAAIIKYLSQLKTKTAKVTDTEVFIPMKLADLLGIGEHLRIYHKDQILVDVDNGLVIA